MAVTLTESEKLKIAQILGVNYIEVNDQIFNLGDTWITPAVEDGVRELIGRWDAGVGSDFVSVEPNTANFGARINPDLEKADIRRSIANLLYLTHLASGQVRLVRG
jgi:hypothetical protein